MPYKECPGYKENGYCRGYWGGKCKVTEKSMSERFYEQFRQISLLDVCLQSSLFGNDYYIITDDDIKALKSGKILYSSGEYGTFIKYNQDEEKANT